MRPSNADLCWISGSTGGSSQPSKAGIDVDDDAFLVRSCSVASAAAGPWPGTGAPQWHGDPGLSASSSRRQAQYSRSTEAGESAPRRRLGPATVSAITPRCSYTFKYILWNTNTHTHPFNGPFSGTIPGSAGTRKVKPIWILLKQQTVSGSGISWPHASLHLAPDR